MGRIYDALNTIARAYCGYACEGEETMVAHRHTGPVHKGLKR